MKKLLAILLILPLFANSQTLIADTTYYDGGAVKVVTYHNYATTVWSPRSDTIGGTSPQTAMTTWSAQQSIATLVASIAGKQASLSGTGFIKATGSTISYDNSTYATAASSTAFTNKTGAISQWTNDLSYLTSATLPNAKADGSTKGIAAFDANYFDDNGSGIISWNLTTGSGTVSSSAVTINTPRGKISYSPSILAAGTATFTFTNSLISSTSVVSVGLNGNGSNLISVNCYIKSQTAGSCVVAIQNLSLLNLFNTNMVIDFIVVN